MRKSEHLTHDTFFPSYGITAGEFAIWQIPSENRKSRKRENKNITEETDLIRNTDDLA